MPTAHAGFRVAFVCLVLAASAAPAAVPAAGSDSGPAAAVAPEDVDPDTVRLLIDVHEDGTAVWHVEYRIELDDENRTEAFESLEADVESNPDSYAAEFRDVMQPSVDQAARSTGREMALRNVTVATSREVAPPTGVVTYTFEWTRFAATDGDRLVVGDAIDGFYVSEETLLRIEWPEGYELDTVRPTPDERSDGGVAWHGRTAFGTDEPRVALAPAPDAGSGVPVPLSLAAAAALALAATLGLVGRARRDTDANGRDATGGPDAHATAAAGDGDSDDPPPAELLSNEEQVIATLEQHGGRMKQQDLAEHLEWGAPKTSRVVGSLREEDEVQVFRLGRENVVTLPEEDLLS